MSKLFSERMGYTPPKPLQLESMDEDLRNSLWNAFYDGIFGIWCADLRLLRNTWKVFFKKPLSSIDHITENVVYDEDGDPFLSIDKDDISTHLKKIEEILFNEEWYKIYDLIEHVLPSITDFGAEEGNKFQLEINNILVKEKSGYRLIAGKFTPITNPTEIGTIKEALSFTALEGVNGHLTKALSFFADREKPDYANSIKEVISAIESFVKTLSKSKKGTLGQQLKNLDFKLELNPLIITSIEKLYAYSNDKNGIRHAAL